MQWLKKLFQHGNGKHLARPTEAKNQSNPDRPGQT